MLEEIEITAPYFSAIGKELSDAYASKKLLKRYNCPFDYTSFSVTSLLLFMVGDVTYISSVLLEE